MVWKWLTTSSNVRKDIYTLIGCVRSQLHMVWKWLTTSSNVRTDIYTLIGCVRSPLHMEWKWLDYFFKCKERHLYPDWLCEITTTHGVEVTDYFLKCKERHLYPDWLCKITTTHGVQVTDYFLKCKERHSYPDWLCEITTTHGVDRQLKRTPAWVEIVLHHLEVKNGFNNAIFNTGYNNVILWR